MANCKYSTSAKIHVNGVDLHYEKNGDSTDAVLCLPGALGSTQSDFGPQLKALSADFTVVAFDPRGYGKSIPPKRDFPLDFFQRDASDGAALMANLGKTVESLVIPLSSDFITHPKPDKPTAHVLTHYLAKKIKHLPRALQWQ